MKKTLLFLSILFPFYFVSAQICSVTSIGGAPSASGSAGGEQRQLSYNKDINTVAFIHKTSCDFFSYDISTDGGATWSSNQQSIYGPVSNPSCVSHPGKLPKGMIYNPAGNTNPASAHISYAGNWSGTPGGKVNGTGHFDLSAPNENYDNLPSGDAISVEDIFVSKTGESWIVGKLMNTFIFQDTITLFKGTWSGSDFVYSYYPVQFTTNPDFEITDMNIAFADDGLTGYIALISNQDIGNVLYIDTVFYMQVLKTTDGGLTWNCPIDLDIRTCLDAAMVGQGNTIYASTWDLDIVVDKNNNPHIVNTIVPKVYGLPGGVRLEYQSGTFGLFDFYSTDQGLTWLAQLIAHPQTFSAQWGIPTEFLRPFASRSWDGSKLFFGFFDTDTATFFTYDNVSPDLRLIGYDVDNNKWTADLSNLAAIDGGENITTLSSAGGECKFGVGSYYTKDDGISYSVPVVYMVMGPTPSDPVQYYYIDCASPSGTFTFNGNPIPVTTAYNSPLCLDGSGVVLTVDDLSNGLLVSGNYPNPFTGKTSVDVTLAKAGDVSVEISNVVGQKLVSAAYQNLHTGLNTLTLDASSLAHGLYFFTVKAGSKSVTKTMTVE